VALRVLWRRPDADALHPRRADHQGNRATGGRDDAGIAGRTCRSGSAWSCPGDADADPHAVAVADPDGSSVTHAVADSHADGSSVADSYADAF
jgi:hypothetical protein